MRVALLSYNALAGDAIGNQLAEKLAFFLERGADVRIFLESDQRLHPALRSHTHLLSGQESEDDAWQFLASADLVMADYSQSYSALWLLPLLAGGRPRIVFDYHSVTPASLWTAQNREAVVQGARNRGLAWCADAALVHSRFAQDELREATAFPTDRATQVGYAVDTGWFCPGPATNFLRGKLGLESATLLLFVGRVAPNKRIPVLVEAMARLRDRNPPVHALIVGDQRDVYQIEAQRCQELAGALGIGDRLHFLGHVDDHCLHEAYRSADLFVMPSLHEGFCIPVIEAMASGLPVIAARAAALPETVGDAGLTFQADDADDLARQIERVLSSHAEQAPIGTPRLRVAVVTSRFGDDFVGGAETSLRSIACNLHQAGHHVEVFSTCAQTEDGSRNHLPEGSAQVDGLMVHRFLVDPCDRDEYVAAWHEIEAKGGQVATEVEQQFLKNSLRSSGLMERLAEREADFDALIVGPYLVGLTCDVARAFPDRTLVVPCFHDEPAARLRAFHQAYEQVGGILYHSAEEQELAEIGLGLNHPGACCIGTFIDTASRGNPSFGQSDVGTGKRYLIYCGRYAPLKNLPLLLQYASRYAQEYPDRFTFAFIGQGTTPIPRESWACDLGFIDRQKKANVLAGAAALVQLSVHESLSLAAIEAWAQGVPVLAGRGCAVLRGHMRHCHGGRLVDSYLEFAAGLDDLWDHPQKWEQLGRNGQKYVRTRYGSAEQLTTGLEGAIRSLTEPLAEQMRRQGRARAESQFSRKVWRERFGSFVEGLLHASPRAFHEAVEVHPVSDTRTASSSQDTTLVPVRVANRGTHAVASEGPAAVMLRGAVVAEAIQEEPGPAVPLSEILMPGRTLTAVVPVPVPAVPGEYQVELWAERRKAGSAMPSLAARFPSSNLRLVVGDELRGGAMGLGGALRFAVEKTIAQADPLHRLPDGYEDITQGWLAPWKRRVKQKLLHNFKHAYLDVLSRQQSGFNRQVLKALHELTEYCSALEHALQVLSRPTADQENRERSTSVGEPQPMKQDLPARVTELSNQLANSERRCDALEARLAQLERRLSRRQEVHS